jgi:hypothetical protein
VRVAFVLVLKLRVAPVHLLLRVMRPSAVLPVIVPGMVVVGRWVVVPFWWGCRVQLQEAFVIHAARWLLLFFVGL